MNKVTVHIFGREYSLMSDKSKEFIIRVASYVDDEINKVASELKNPVRDDILILACNNIAEKLLLEQSKDIAQENNSLNKTIENLQRENASLMLELEQKDVRLKSYEMSGGIDPQELAKIEKEKAQQRETVKKLNDQIEKYKILNDCPNKRVRLMFQDKAGFGRINKPKYCWCNEIIRPKVPCHHIRDCRYVYAANRY